MWAQNKEKHNQWPSLHCATIKQTLTSLTGSGTCATCAIGRPMRARLLVKGELNSELFRELCKEVLRELCRELPREPCPDTTCRRGPRLSGCCRPLEKWAGAVAGFCSGWGRGASEAAWEKVTIFSEVSPASSMLCRLFSAQRSEGCLRMGCSPSPSVERRVMMRFNSLEMWQPVLP